MMANRVQAYSWWALAFSLIFVASNSSLVGISFAVIAALALSISAGSSSNAFTSARFYVQLATLILLTRVAFRIIFNFGGTGDIALSLPYLTLELGPLGNLHLLGSVSWLTLQAAFIDGLRLGAIILSVGMANSIADSRALMRSLPSALREIGLSISIAINLAPQLIASIQRVRKAQSLRGRSAALKTLPGLVVPILEDAIDKSMALAASMDSRGFGGRLVTGKLNSVVSRASSAAALFALAFAFVELLIVPNGQTVGLALVAGAILLLSLTIFLNSQNHKRTRYRSLSPSSTDYAVLGIAGLLVALNLLGVLK